MRSERKPARELRSISVRRVSAKKFHSSGIPDAFENFENREMTVSHMFRRPHSVLGGLSYGAAFRRALVARGIGRGNGTFWEIGGGCGYFAESFLGAGPVRRYTIVDLAPALIEAQRGLLGENPRVEWVRGDCEHLPFAPGSIDGVVIANEMIADLDAWVVRAEGQATRRPGIRPSRGLSRVEARERLRRYGMNFHRTTGASIFPAGFTLLLENLRRAMRPGATAVISEYFVMNLAGQLAKMPGHAEFALSLPMACHLSEKAGFTVKAVSLMDFLDMDLSARVVASGLRRLARNFLEPGFSHTLPAEEEMLSRLAGGRRRLGEEFFDRAELLRILGQFYVLVLRPRLEIRGAHPAADAVFEPEPGVLHIHSDREGHALVKSHPFRVRSINETGAWIWKRMSAGESAGRIAAGLSRRHGISRRRALVDVRDFFGMLQKERLAGPVA